MASEMETVEQRLKSFMGQLQTENGILERLVYKHKNQHRRCRYFQYVLKVRRDLKLLQLSKLEDVFDAPFIVINGNRPKQKVQLLESLKRRKSGSGKYNFLERLLGIARLLSQIIEPLIKAAMEISTLLAQSFFTKFALTTLAVLARIRVLVQQMLLDAVLIYNTASSICQREQTVKLNQEGFEVFREYYPIKEEDSIVLECIWETDKYVLVEKQHKIEANSQEKDVLLSASRIQYENIEIFLGVEESLTPVAQHGQTNVDESRTNFEINKDENPIQDPSDTASPSTDVNIVSTGDVLTNNTPVGLISLIDDKKADEVVSCTVEASPPITRASKSRVTYPVKGKNESKKVAFISIKPPAPPSTTDGSKKRVDKDDDPFFDLLTGGNKKSRLF